MKGVCIIGHGSSNANAIKNAIRVASEYRNRPAIGQKIRETLELASRCASARWHDPCCTERLIATLHRISLSRTRFTVRRHGTRTCRHVPGRAGDVRRSRCRTRLTSSRKLCFEGPEDQLKLTEITQPAILTVSVAAFRVLRETRASHRHSLPDTAWASIRLTLPRDAVVRRTRCAPFAIAARYMQEAVPVGVGAMAAILGIAQRQAAADM